MGAAFQRRFIQRQGSGNGLIAPCKSDIRGIQGFDDYIRRNGADIRRCFGNSHGSRSGEGGISVILVSDHLEPVAVCVCIRSGQGLRERPFLRKSVNDMAADYVGGCDKGLFRSVIDQIGYCRYRSTGERQRQHRFTGALNKLETRIIAREDGEVVAPQPGSDDCFRICIRQTGCRRNSDGRPVLKASGHVDDYAPRQSYVVGVFRNLRCTRNIHDRRGPDAGPRETHTGIMTGDLTAAHGESA